MSVVCHLLKGYLCFYCRYHAYSVCMFWLYAVYRWIH